MKQLKDYLHYYMGATFWTDNSQGEVNPTTLQFIYPMIEIKHVQLQLRRLEDMTEEERVEIFGPDTHWYKPFDATDACDSQQWHKLLSKHFDMFGLIEAGLAVDIKTITP